MQYSYVTFFGTLKKYLQKWWTNFSILKQSVNSNSKMIIDEIYYTLNRSRLFGNTFIVNTTFYDHIVRWILFFKNKTIGPLLGLWIEFLSFKTEKAQIWRYMTWGMFYIFDRNEMINSWHHISVTGIFVLINEHTFVIFIPLSRTFIMYEATKLSFQR